jgi:drug/metabolite transporter (DMT)-like permease
MKEAKTKDIFLLLLLGAIWGSSFFNIKIATYSFEPYTLALVRVIFAAIFLLVFSFLYKIKIDAFSKDWKIYALVGLCNIAIPFSLIAVGTNKVDSYLAAILMSTTPLTGSILAHIFTKNEKFRKPECNYLHDDLGFNFFTSDSFYI